MNLADYKLSNKKTGKPITIESITQVNAEINHLPYKKIDPTKVNVNQVTSAVSQAYAKNLIICGPYSTLSLVPSAYLYA